VSVFYFVVAVVIVVLFWDFEASRSLGLLEINIYLLLKLQEAKMQVTWIVLDSATLCWDKI
jgi:hypothetical protein